MKIKKMKIKKMVKALNKIKMLCESKASCRTCLFYASPGNGCIFLEHKLCTQAGVLPQKWDLDCIDVDYEKK